MEWFLLLAVVAVLALLPALKKQSGADTGDRARPERSSKPSSSSQVVRGAKTRFAPSPTESVAEPTLRTRSTGGGIVQYHGLTDWWVSEFSDQERGYISQRFTPMGSGDRELDEGHIHYSSQSAVAFLAGLAGWFYKSEDRHLAHRIFQKAEALASDEYPALDLHFLYGQMIEIYYKDRSDPMVLEKAIQSCEKQIAMSDDAVAAFMNSKRFEQLPSHKGYTQLAIILEKNKEFERVIQLCRKADSQGWAGDWAKRIDRCEKKLRIS